MSFLNQKGKKKEFHRGPKVSSVLAPQLRSPLTADHDRAAAAATVDATGGDGGGLRGQGKPLSSYIVQYTYTNKRDIFNISCVYFLIGLYPYKYRCIFIISFLVLDGKLSKRRQI
jgi:hypothetical protein